MKENLSICYELLPSFSPKKEINFNLMKEIPLKLNRHKKNQIGDFAINFIKEIPLKVNRTKKSSQKN